MHENYRKRSKHSSLSKPDYLGFVMIEGIVLIDDLQPARDVGNIPPCLFGGLSVVIDPISMNVWNVKERKKATRTLLK